MISHYNRLLIATIFASGTMAIAGRMTSIAYVVFETHFGASIESMQWVMTAPVLVTCSLILVGGRLGDFFGKRRLFRTGLIAFSVGALLSALAPDVMWLVIGQGFVGLGMSLALPACLSLIKQEIPEERQKTAIGLWAGIGGAFGVAGLLLGGFIIETWGWSAVFYTALPLGLIAFISVPTELRVESVESSKLNVPAVVAMFLAIALLSFSLITGNQHHWSSPSDFILLAFGIALMGVVLVWQNRSSSPIIPFKFFRNQRVLGANLGTFFMYFSLNAVYIFLIYHVQSFYGYEPTEAGWVMLPASLMVTFFASWFGKLSQKKWGDKSLKLGAFLASIGFAGLVLSGENALYFSHLFPFIVLLGLGMALFVAPITSTALEVEPKESGLASGLNNLIARFSGLLAIGIIGGVFSMVEDQLLRFRVSAIIMASSALLATIFLVVLVRKNLAPH